MTEMIPGKAEINPTDFMDYSFIRQDRNNIPTRTTVIEVNAEDGQVLLEYAHGQHEWVQPNIIQEALLSRQDDGADLWSFKKVLSHKHVEGKAMVELLWDNGDVSWEPVNVIRKDDPVTLATYAKEKGLDNTRGWKWTRSITKNPKKFARMLKIMTGQKKSTKKYMFGIELPRNLKEAIILDKKNGNTKWQDAWQAEIDQLQDFGTFNVEGKGESSLKDYTYVNLIVCFTVKFDGRRKVRIVANGSITEDLGHDIYSGVISIDNVRLALFLAQLNNLEVVATDISGAFLYADCKENIYTVAPDNWGALGGKILKFAKSLYGLKSSSAAFAEHLAERLYAIGFEPSLADSDLWIKDCGEHYEYIATWVDDLLILSKDPMTIVKKLEKLKYEFKGTGTPQYYLGGDIKCDKNNKGQTRITTGARTYINQLTKKVEETMDWTLRSYQSPEDPSYHPEIDQTPLLSPDDIAKYRMLTGSLNWAVTLGRWDLIHASSTYARYNSVPREGHLNGLKRVYGYLRAYAKRDIVFNTDIPDFSEYKIEEFEWARLYKNTSEELPWNMPTPKGNSVKMSGFFDASHASCLETRRSVTGIIMLLNKTPIKWYSKRQATVETSTYGSEIVAGRIAVELAIDLRYRLRMLGVPIEGSTLLFGDNESMIKNCTRPGSTLKKRHNATGFHRCREAIACRVVDMIHCRSEQNHSDVGTKPLGPQIFQKLTKKIEFPSVVVDKIGECQNGTNIPSNPDKKLSRIVIEHSSDDNELTSAMASGVFRDHVVKQSLRYKGNADETKPHRVSWKEHD